jgi:hypothetical protein
MNKTIIASLLTLVLILLAILYNDKQSFRGATPGLESRIATSTLVRPVTTTQSILFATSTCATRFITTNAGGIYLSFSDDFSVPTATSGHFQAGSTTVAYNAEEYGCKTFRAISATGATVNVTVSESR